jgi:hypothetical protein
LRLYRDVWVTATAVMVTAGLWAALVIGTVPGVLGMFVSFAMLGAVVGFIQVKGDRPGARRRAVVGGSLASASLVAAGGLVGVFGPEAIWLVVAAMLSSPWTLTLSRRILRRVNPGYAAPADPAPPPAEQLPQEMFSATTTVVTEPDKVGLLDDRALCLAWRRSFVTLQHSRTGPSMLTVVEQRQLYLDELERRNPAGLSAWLESGARAAGDPSRFFLLQ